MKVNGSAGEIYRNFFYLRDRRFRVRELVWAFFARYDPKACTRAFDSEEYERAIREAGGIDFQILGIGKTGHVGFNEPGSGMESRTRLIHLDTITRRDAAADFFGEENVPREAITMGVGTILDAREIVLIATGEHKAGIIRRTVEGDISREVAGIVTSTGGQTSHAAILARSRGIPAVTGLRAVLDTVGGVARVSWNKARYGSLETFMVYRDPRDAADPAQQPIALTRDTFWIDTLYPPRLDGYGLATGRFPTPQALASSSAASTWSGAGTRRCSTSSSSRPARTRTRSSAPTSSPPRTAPGWCTWRRRSARTTRTPATPPASPRSSRSTTTPALPRWSRRTRVSRSSTSTSR